jgi:hypothetical protein
VCVLFAVLDLGKHIAAEAKGLVAFCDRTSRLMLHPKVQPLQP